MLSDLMLRNRGIITSIRTLIRSLYSNTMRPADSLSSTITLNDGHVMPLFGLGSFDLEDGNAEKISVAAIENGYRLLDTATYYNNETEVGRAVRTCGLPREQLFVVTKLLWDDHGSGNTRNAIERSLRLLDIGYIDLYLIHSPSGGKILETYDAILEYQKKGLIRSVGVSNFGVHHLRCLKNAGRPTPSVNQIELHPWQHHTDIVKYCRDEGIAVMGYSPLAKGRFFNDGAISKIAQRQGKSPGQIMIRWSVQKCFITIPKTSSLQRLTENADVFSWSLTESDMSAIDKFPQKSVMRGDATKTQWSPDTD